MSIQRNIYRALLCVLVVALVVLTYHGGGLYHVGFRAESLMNEKPTTVDESKRIVSGRKLREGDNGGQQEIFWLEVEKDFDEFNDSFSPILTSSATRGILINDVSYQFWITQLSSSDSLRSETAERILSMMPQFSPATLESNFDEREYGIALELAKTMNFAMQELDGERRLIGLLIEDGQYPPDVKATDIANGVYFPDDGKLYSIPQNTDIDFIKDSESILRHFAPRLKDEDSKIQEGALSVLNYYTYGLYQEDGIEFWESALNNIDNLEAFFEEASE
jgi:hypothetical protein